MRPTPLERVSATGALVALAAEVVFLAAGTTDNLGGFLLMVAGLMVMIGAFWYAVSRRGPARTIGATVGVVTGIVLLIVGVTVVDASAPRMVAIAVLAATSVAMARIALRRSRRALRRHAHTREPAPPAQHPALIMNPKSGGGKAEKFHLVDECRERGIEPIVLQPGDDLLQLAETAIANGADVIGMAGGDGSQALVASVAIQHDVPHVVIPAGTRNHFALDLGLNRDDVVGALDAFADGYEQRIDLATVNGRVFVNNASVGLYAKIVQSPEYRDAKRATTTTMLPELIGPNATPMDLRFTGPDGTQYPTAQVIMVSNDPYDLHTITGRGTRERLDQGMLGIVSARISTAAELSRFVALEAAGRGDRFKGLLEWAAPEFRIDSNGPVEIGVDGEAMKLDAPLVFESLPGVLRVRIPRHAAGHSPAARAAHVLRTSTIAQLLGVIAGRPAD
jgi:diacylglycerol kinase family enzyme